jgi:hypothetical protein
LKCSPILSLSKACRRQASSPTGYEADFARDNVWCYHFDVLLSWS